MKKIVPGFALFVLAFAALAAEAPATPQFASPKNGSEWLKLTSTEKLYWTIGYTAGADACAAESENASNVPAFELVSDLERFYAEPANREISPGTAIRTLLQQASAKDQPSTPP